jgi:hypothetical protein
MDLAAQLVWSITPAGTRGLLNDALAVYVNTPACALALVEQSG